ncbi:MAG: phage tail tube protein [Dehalococcoidia bacterium]
MVTDLDASGGFESDLTQINQQDVLQGFFFADLRRKSDVGDDRQPRRAGIAGQFEDFLVTDIDTTADTITVDSRVAVSAVVVAAGTGYADGDIVEVTDGNATVLARFLVTGETGGLVDTVALTFTGFTGGLEGRTETDTGAGAATTAISGSGDNALTLTLTYTNGITWQAGDIVLSAGQNDAANEGILNVASVSDNVITMTENLTTDATPAATATLTTVGFLTATDDIDVDATLLFPALVASALDFTTMGLVEGEWIFIGGDAATSDFSNTVNNGFKRIRSIAAKRLEFDKSDNTMVDETASSIDVQLFFGRVLKNELAAAIIRRTYQLERQLGAPDVDLPAEIQAEYVEGAVPSEWELSVPSADKVLTNLSFIGADNSTIDGPTALKTGTRPALIEADAFNTSSDFSRIRMAIHTDGTEAPTPLFAFGQEFSITINNNVSPNKAVGTLGAFEVTAGTFQVGGSVTAYFASEAAIQSVRANANITLDMIMVKGAAGAKSGLLIDLPLITMGDGRPNVEQDQPITLPLSMDAATAALIDPALDYTALMVFFDFLPNAADV